MSDKNSPAIEQIITILNNSPTAIYVSAIDNYELLYINEKARAFSRATQPVRNEPAMRLPVSLSPAHSVRRPK